MMGVCWCRACRLCASTHGWLTLRRALAIIYISSLFVASEGSTSWPSFKSLQFVTEPNDTIAVHGQSVQLPCKALYEGRPPTVTTWTLHNELLTIWTSHQSRRLVLENGSLLITNVGQVDPHPDEGQYRCVAEVADPDANLRIATPQVKLEMSSMARQFEREPRDLLLNNSDTAMFACKIASRPLATYTWLREDGADLATDRVRMYPDDGVLEIQALRTSDFGGYRCHATTVVGGVRTTRMSELYRLARTTMAASTAAAVTPTFVMRPWDTAVREGGSATLFCAANGPSATGRLPTITWLKEGSTIDVADGRHVVIVGAGSLRLFSASEADTGMYTCRADNGDDSVDADAMLRVLVPPRLTKKPSNTYARKDEDVDLECAAYGVPSPRVYWLKDSEELTDNDYFRVMQGRGLRIVGLMESDSGAYQCMAESEVGSTHAIAQLIVLPVGTPEGASEGEAATTPSSVSAPRQPTAAKALRGPSAPRKLSAPVVMTTSVSLLWEEPDWDGGAAIASYHITAKEADSSRLRSANVSTMTFTLSSLKPDTEYGFRVLAVNGDGRLSEEAAELSVRTRPELAVPPAPTGFRVLAVSSTEVRASWAALSTPNQAATSYKVYYYSRDQSKEQAVNTTALTVLLDRLSVHTDYYVRVAAVNAVGEGVPSEEMSVRTYSAIPGAVPQNVTSEATSTTALLVQWQPPPPDRQNGIITGYKVRYKERDRFGRADTVTTDGDARSYELTGLEPGESYMVRVAATNVNGTGDYTPWLTIATYTVDLDESTTPAKPLFIQTKAFATEMIINWGAPSGHVVIRGYKLGYGQITPDERWVELEASERYYTLKNLQSTQSYVVQLLAYNRAGSGFPIMAQEFTREQVAAASSGSGGSLEAPVELTPPLEVKAVVLSSTSIAVLWHDNSLGSNQRVTDNRYYTVKYTALTGALRKPKTINSTELTIIVEGLRPYTKYEFAVKVVKGRRESVYSLNQRNTTFESAPGSPPRDLTITASDSSSNELVLSWQPPVKPNGRLISYLIYYATENRADVRYWVIEAVSYEWLNKRIRPVTPDTTYFFKIEAHNAKGRGPMSATEVFRTPKADGTGGGGILVNSGSRSSAADAVGDRGGKETVLQTDAELLVKPSGGAAPGAISSETMWIVIGCVGAVTTAAIISLVAVLCRRRLLSPERKNKRAGLKQANKTTVRGACKDQPPDLWIHHELKQVERSGGSGGGSPAFTTPDTMAEPEEMIPMLDPNQRYDIDRSVGGDTFLDSYSSLGRSSRPTVFVTAHGGLREGMPRAAVPPMSAIATEPLIARPAYPRTQYNQQYGSGARVHVGDSSIAVATTKLISSVSSNDVSSGSCHPPHSMNGGGGCGVGAPPEGRVYPLRSFNIPGPPPVTPPCAQSIPKHIVRPQPSSPYKAAGAAKTSNVYTLDPSECGSLKRPLRGEAVSTPSGTVRPGPDVLIINRNDVDLRKTHSTEQLNEEMANLEGIMKDINAIKMQFEY